MPPLDHRPAKPIVLALGGGAALGWAHIGVLRVLAEQGIAIGAIAGTSMGALAGLCWSAGRLDVFEEIARGFTRRRLLGFLDLQVAGGALLAGRRIARELDAHFGDVRLEALPVPLAIVAADIDAVEEVRLTHGRAVDAVRGSIALPALFPPFALGGRTLIDGGCVAMVPVGAARALAPDLPMIAVDLVGGFDGVRGTPATARATLRAAFLTTMTIQVRQALALDPADVIIRPDVRHLTPMHFHRGEELIALGRRAAEEQMPAIRTAIAA